jgi:hypothetical protein
MGASSLGAFRRMVKYTNGWIGMIYGSSENFQNTINMIKDMANQENEKGKEEKGANSNNENGFKLILLSYPKVVEETEQDPSKKEDQRPPMTGTIEEIGSDLKKIKDIGVEHVIFGYSFGPIGRDVDKMIDTTKQLSKFC